MSLKLDQKYLGVVYSLAGAFCIIGGWNWYHLSKHNWNRFAMLSVIEWLVVVLGYNIFRSLLRFIFIRHKRHSYWKNDFIVFLDKLFFSCSLLFLVFFSQSELISLGYVSAIFLFIFYIFQRFLKRHPEPGNWLKVNKVFFIVGFYLFVVQAVAQYSAYHYYILDSNIRFFNIVLFRALAMTFFWLLLFILASGIFLTIKNRYLRYVPFVLWFILFGAFTILWVINIGILYFSGLYFSPVVLEHLNGSSGVVFNYVTVYLVAGGVLVATLMAAVLSRALKFHRAVPKRYWFVYNVALGIVALAGLFGLASFKNTPEHAIAKSFYDYFFGNDEKVTLDPVIQKKLEKFGLYYSPNSFHVAEKDTVFNSTSTLKLLPDRFKNTRPNILIIFLESYSARLTDVYNSKFTDLTPGFDEFAANPHTTIFKKYYNASTPTITGTLSQLCSFLPPTGHEEIQNERKLQNHHLLCLPEVLKKQAGFKYSAYVTAVDKEFAHKDGIFASMGVDKIYGTGELAKVISEEPRSWGYSDHQMFPAVWNMMQSAPEPFLMMLATVDTHPPFNLAKDAVNYKDGSQPVLNMFHTTDDAFKHFWDTFKVSPLYKNTIVITVADHAIFPGALTKDINDWPGNLDTKSVNTYYDQNTFMMYIPDNVLPKTVDMYASGIDVLPTLLHIFGINIPNSFEGHSIFDDRKNYPNLLGMHELGLYINQETKSGKRSVNYNVPTEIQCNNKDTSSTSTDLTLCEYLSFFHWKRQMFEEGRFWKN